ncbi:hypothetical protein BSZ39_09960 [Bowdeniella nasicola]|uniref:Uncharacterized protein n=1 Tax=Bowdeniella nasicola TaxID=208480 RepID=A0A1Q5Q0L6_9ACTO|nr:C69 family dipeptidase [Bowdeniella nasicola]OKL53347.1 hypothetical protein BSZ39_09960 [Bowdeniella nasicola]
MKRATTLSAALITLLASLLFGSSVWACTGVIIGADLTEDGSAIFGRTEDLEQNHPKRLIVNEAGKYPAGKAIVGAETGVSYTQEKDSLKFTSVSDITPAEGRFDEAGFNSAGVAVDATVSAKANKKILSVDPYTKQGWTEGVLATVLLANSTSAKDAIDRMAALVEKDGASEGNILVVGDKTDVWYMEIYSGHQYAAMKYPRDKFSVYPNTFYLNRVNCADSANFVCSKDLIKTAKDADSYVETGGQFDPAASYRPGMTAGNASRSYSGIKALDPGSKVTLDQDSYALLQTPSKSFKKLSIADVMAMQRNRFEGVDDTLAKLSEKVVDDHGMKGADGKPVEGAHYPIGNTNTMEAHIFQIPKSGMPKEIPGTLWQTIGTPQGAPYMPYYGNIDQTIEPMQSTSKDPSDMSSYYWLASAVNKFVNADRATVAGPVREYLNAFEAPLIAARSAENIELVTKHAADPEVATSWANAIFLRAAEESYNNLKALLESLKVYNTEHQLKAEDGSYVTVAPKQVVLPTQFVAHRDELPNPPKGTKVYGTWSVELLQHMPWGKMDHVQPNGKVTVSLKYDGDAEGAELWLLKGGEENHTVIPHTVKDGFLTFETDTLGAFALAKRDVPSPDPTTEPTADPTVAPTTAPAPTAAPAPQPTGKAPVKPGIPRTGGNVVALALIALGAVTGGGILVARRRSSES